jgi:hypothetical protein
MQTLVGFWIFSRRSSLMGGTYQVFYADDGFGELTPIAFPVHAINTANQ